MARREIQSVSLKEHPYDWQEHARKILRGRGSSPDNMAVSEKKLWLIRCLDYALRRLIWRVASATSVAKIEQVGDELFIVLHIQDYVCG